MDLFKFKIPHHTVNLSCNISFSKKITSHIYFVVIVILEGCMKSDRNFAWHNLIKMFYNNWYTFLLFSQR